MIAHRILAAVSYRCKQVCNPGIEECPPGDFTPGIFTGGLHSGGSTMYILHPAKIIIRGIVYIAIVGRGFQL